MAWCHNPCWHLQSRKRHPDVKRAPQGSCERSTACGAAESYTKYYVALGRVIAQRTGTIAGGVPDAGTLSYLLADHLVAVVGSAEYDSYLDILLITRVRSSHIHRIQSGSG